MKLWHYLYCFTVALVNLTAFVFSIDSYSRNDFPCGFVFGSGSSAYQVEGAANEDGRTPSDWDTLVHSDQWHSGTGDVAVDGYHKYKEDVRLMVETGLDAYRFSISWSRLIPNGRGSVNPKGLQYYNNLIDELISHGIEPHVTLFHYDHPQALEDEYGGWVSRKIIKDFTAYAEVCFREFGDMVSQWTTMNEPNVLVLGGYDEGFFPPNRCSYPFGIINCHMGNSSSEPYLAAHHILLSHASAARLYKKKYQGKQHGFIGFNVFMYGIIPLTNSSEDLLAAQRANDFMVGIMVNPLVFGDYPSVVKKNAGLRLPAFTNYESKLVKGSFDFLGVNHYSMIHVKDNPDSLKLENRDMMQDMGVVIDMWNSSSLEFPIEPQGLQMSLEYLKQVYGNPPIYIHEDGQITERKSSLEDISRVNYLHSYIGTLLDPIKNGSNVRGYFTWSFLDAFELLDGDKSSFGLYYVDLDDPELKRYPKLSAQWYSHFLKGGNVSSDEVVRLYDNSTMVLVSVD